MTERDTSQGYNQYLAINELTEAQNKLKESEDEFRRILSEIPLSMSVISLEGQVLLVNKKTLDVFDVKQVADIDGKFSQNGVKAKPLDMFDKGEADLTGFNVTDIWQKPEQRDEWLRELRTHGVISDYMIDVVSITGVQKTLRISGLMITFEGRPCILSVHEDVTEKKKIEEDLRISREMYRDLTDNAPIGILTCDRNGWVTYANYKVPEILGAPSIEKMTEVNLLQSKSLIKAGSADVLKHVIEDGAEYPDYEVQFTSVWGKKVFLRVHISPVLEEGTPVGARLILDDITRRKEAELLLERTQFAFDHSPDEIYFVNRAGLIVYANAQARTSFGIEPNSLLSTSIYDINPNMSSEYRRAVWSHLERDSIYRFESVHQKPDGTKYPVDIIKYRITFEGESLSCSIARDITQSKKTEERLRESEGRLRTLIQTIPDMIWLKDVNGVYLACNSTFEALLGAKESEIVGKNDYDYIEKEQSDIYHESDRQTILTKKPTIHEEWVTFATDGRRALLETVRTPLYTSDGVVSGVLGIGRDITERKQSEDAIRGVNRKLSLLSSITRHDILNQITGAAGYLEIIELEDEIPHDAKTKEYLKIISGAVGTIERQITFTGYYKDLGEQAPDWFDVQGVIGHVRETPSFEKVRIENTIENIEVFADPLFEKVIYNLIDNAVKHGETITKITFSANVLPEELVIFCEDDGVGIPVEFKEKIFRREHYKNSGLGLFLSREILAITGSTITETGTPGVGARFEIHVPKGMFRVGT